MEELKNIIESLLFVSDTPISVDQIRHLLPETAATDVRQALRDLAADYEYRGGGFHLKEVAGGFQIRTRPQYREYVKRLVEPSPSRLSKAALETLAIVAYKQPVIRSEIEQLRGVDCGGVLRLLMERKLIRVLGRKEIPGRPLIYATTREFLEVFDLKDLRDLPTPKEIEDLGKEEVELPEDVVDEPEAEDESEVREENDDLQPSTASEVPEDITEEQRSEKKDDDSLHNP